MTASISARVSPELGSLHWLPTTMRTPHKSQKRHSIGPAKHFPIMGIRELLFVGQELAENGRPTSRKFNEVSAPASRICGLPLPGPGLREVWAYAVFHHLHECCLRMLPARIRPQPPRDFKGRGEVGFLNLVLGRF